MTETEIQQLSDLMDKFQTEIGIRNTITCSRYKPFYAVVTINIHGHLCDTYTGVSMKEIITSLLETHSSGVAGDVSTNGVG